MQSQHRHRRDQELQPLFLVQQVLLHALHRPARQLNARRHRMTMLLLPQALCTHQDCDPHKNLVQYRDARRRREPSGLKQKW